ncbi:MAG: glycosyltransferase family 2 protein, partial [Spirochaetales bacterium]|nr:glycosyltransferase family 2 protein [Candidatus Physcosoma equi]
MTIFLLLVTVLSLLMGLWTLLCTLVNCSHFAFLRKKAKNMPLGDNPLVSVIIPARNEENNLGRLLESLTKQSYRNLEILVINDASTDRTESIIREYEKKGSRIKGYSSSPEVHFTKHGKMNALLQVIPKAKGEYLVLTDADTEEKSTCVETALRLMRSKNADIFSAFPAQYSSSDLSRLLTTCMVFAIIALPTVLINALQWARFSIGIGQFIMMRRSAYEECGGYMAVKDEVCDDIAIIKRFMRSGKKYLFTTLSSEVGCYMYEDGISAFHGLERSISSVFPSTVTAFVEVLFIVVVLL